MVGSMQTSGRVVLSASAVMVVVRLTFALSGSFARKVTFSDGDSATTDGDDMDTDTEIRPSAAAPAPVCPATTGSRRHTPRVHR